ncbi:hypothetical protein HELRODRAFT_175488 [Helobdella robusta]|uniref:RNF31 C-terminal domain-containing protein n=1 Tax=Helobdella robusta TaxID=6412 RepID=T1F9B4_HELRO|nr:hypothetical protein HELRODRAFT_175488 [Helobdella robusta]ESO00531.1 hypothetical protein HELRODRAFT_175488 [Helobdella robusta]
MENINALKRSIVHQFLNLFNPNEALKIFSNIHVDFKEKYKIVKAEELVVDNCKNVYEVKLLIVALRVLSKYAANILLPVQMRPNGWKTISYFNKIYNEKVHPIIGTDEILEKLNYEKLPNKDFEYVVSDTANHSREYVAEKGLHCKHPRNCLDRLRDMDVKSLQNFLEVCHESLNCGMAYWLKRTSSSSSLPMKCHVTLMRDDRTEGPCGGESLEGYAGMCRKHYTEYLVDEINIHKLDPLHMMSTEELSINNSQRNRSTNHRRNRFEVDSDHNDYEIVVLDDVIGDNVKSKQQQQQQQRHQHQKQLVSHFGTGGNNSDDVADDVTTLCIQQLL